MGRHGAKSLAHLVFARLLTRWPKSWIGARGRRCETRSGKRDEALLTAHRVRPAGVIRNRSGVGNVKQHWGISPIS